MGHMGVMMEISVIRVCHRSLSSAMHTSVEILHFVHSVYKMPYLLSKGTPEISTYPDRYLNLEAAFVIM